MNTPYICLLFNHHSYIIRQALQTPFSRSQTGVPRRVTCLWKLYSRAWTQTLVCLIPHPHETVFRYVLCARLCFRYRLCREGETPFLASRSFWSGEQPIGLPCDDTAGQGMQRAEGGPESSGCGPRRQGLERHLDVWCVARVSCGKSTLGF